MIDPAQHFRFHCYVFFTSLVNSLYPERDRPLPAQANISQSLQGIDMIDPGFHLSYIFHQYGEFS
jgi:hypothetical protein